MSALGRGKEEKSKKKDADKRVPIYGAKKIGP